MLENEADRPDLLISSPITCRYIPSAFYMLGWALIVVLNGGCAALIRCRTVLMNSTKIQRVRRLIADGVYTNSDVLDCIEEILVHRHYDRLMRDIESHSEVAEDRCDEIAVVVYSEAVKELRRRPAGRRNRYDDVVAAFFACSLGALTKLVLARSGSGGKSRLAT